MMHTGKRNLMTDKSKFNCHDKLSKRLVVCITLISKRSETVEITCHDTIWIVLGANQRIRVYQLSHLITCNCHHGLQDIIKRIWQDYHSRSVIINAPLHSHVRLQISPCVICMGFGCATCKERRPLGKQLLLKLEWCVSDHNEELEFAWYVQSLGMPVTTQFLQFYSYSHGVEPPPWRIRAFKLIKELESIIGVWWILVELPPTRTWRRAHRVKLKESH
jgi:hypothetical protein